MYQYIVLYVKVSYLYACCNNGEKNSWCEHQTWTFLHQGKNRVKGVVGASWIGYD
jgi:hypothetical protein